ncbi:MAG: FAD-dependent oxidoreductase [Planctomycetes bacterium]|nr:FAD-dependent oxidoreductase [Planctomycetota bacterium]
MDVKRYDVVVLGGGFAGVAAAVQAARDRLKVALIERTTLWGGMATSGLVTVYVPLDNGLGRQVTFGLAEELMYRSMRYGPGRIPAKWIKPELAAGLGDVAAENDDGPYMTCFAPHACVMAMDELLEEVSVAMWLDTLACLPLVDGKRITAVEVENKSGRIRIEGDFFVDATGDADIASRAGAPCRETRLRPSMIALCPNVDTVRRAAEAEDLSPLRHWQSFGDNEFERGYEGDCPPLFGGCGRDVSRFVLESRKVARQAIAARQRELGPRGRRQYYPLVTPSLPDIRMTRCIEGLEMLESDMVNRRVETSVGMIADNRKRGTVWEVPYGSLVPRGLENLYVAGRCSGANGYVWQVSRLIQSVALTGQVAGAAAVLCVARKTTNATLDVADVQKKLEGLGIELHL